MESSVGTGWIVFGIIFLIIMIFPSLHSIGQTEIGLVSKRFGRKLPKDNPVAMKKEAGYQVYVLMPGLRWKFWIVFKVSKFPWVQVPAGEIGVVIAQVGEPLPIGSKSAKFKPSFGNFSDLSAFLENGGQKGVQRPVLSPGTLAPIHPIGFLVITKNKVYGLPIDPAIIQRARKDGGLKPMHFGLDAKQLEVLRIQPEQRGEKVNEILDVVGIVTTFEGEPLEGGDIASRLGGFDDIEKMETTGHDDSVIIETLLSSKNHLHNNYQDFEKFLEGGGKIGLQHDPLLYGAYNLNPFLVNVQLVPMLVIEQGQVAVIKAYVGLVTKDTSGADFKFGSLVRPGHRGIWQEPLRTGKYPINPRCYQAEIVPTSILTLNWAQEVSRAHNLDSNLSQIVAKSTEGFVFKIDLQVQIHVPDTKAPRIISMVGTMQNLVNEVLQAAVGNHFRDRLQSMPAIRFIETRQKVQEEAFAYIGTKLSEYQVETKGVYIQDVILPTELVKVLTEREIANQEIATFKKQEESQKARIDMQKTKGQADMQTDLAKSEVNIQIRKNEAEAMKAKADGEATFTKKTGDVAGAAILSIGKANAEAYKSQVEALGPNGTVLVNVAKSLAESKNSFMPQIAVVGSGGNSQDGLSATLMGYVSSLINQNKPTVKDVEAKPEVIAKPEEKQI
jgi:regulator of protease activity HflC (stomatin/prohibitin superfamily)